MSATRLLHLVFLPSLPFLPPFLVLLLVFVGLPKANIMRTNSSAAFVMEQVGREGGREGGKRRNRR